MSIACPRLTLAGNPLPSVMKKKRMSQECINPVIDVKVNVKTNTRTSGEMNVTLEITDDWVRDDSKTIIYLVFTTKIKPP